MSRSSYVSTRTGNNAPPAARSHCCSGSWARERAYCQLEVPSSWHDNGDDGTEGFTLSAKYSLGAIAPSIAYGQLENTDGNDESYLVIGSSYNIGGGLSAFAEYIGLEVEDEDETILLSGVRLDF